MASAFDTSLDTLPTTRATSDAIPASDHNDVADAVNKVEAILGLKSALGAADLARLNALKGDMWTPSGALAVNMPDRMLAMQGAATVNTAGLYLHGGMVLLPGVTYTNINAFCVTAGAGTVTTFWWAVVRLSDMQVLQRTANTTTLPTANAVHTRALQATLTVSAPTPVYIALATQMATTAPGFLSTATGVGAWTQIAPILCGKSTTSPTATPLAVGAVVGALTTSMTTRLYCWLT